MTPVVITNHAALRWSQRGGRGPVLRAFRKARRLGPEKQRHIDPSGQHVGYERDGFVFVARRDGESLVILTVLEAW